MNGKTMLRKTVFATLIVLSAATAEGQRGSYRTALPAVSAAGFYKVMLTPEISAYSTADLRDIRIRDAQGREVSYLRNTDLSARQEGFQPFTVVSNEVQDGNTNIVLRNETSHPIASIELSLRNTEARRVAAISGSSDGRTFYSLKDSVVLDVANGNDGAGICIVPLPPTDYPFLRLTIFNKGGLPVAVLGAGINQHKVAGTQYVRVPEPSFTQRDSSDHKSYICIRFGLPYLVHKMDFSFDSPPFYKRQCTLWADEGAVAEFTVHNGIPNAVWTQLHDTAAMLVINNEDNPPLHLRQISAWQQVQFLIAYLEPGRQYELHFGDAKLAPPLYDLRYFKDTMRTAALMEIVPEEITAVPSASVAPAAVKQPVIGKKTMWAIILIVLAGLIMATVAMMKQIKAKE